jgi:protoporphyrinogen oxidase
VKTACRYQQSEQDHKAKKLRSSNSRLALIKRTKNARPSREGCTKKKQDSMVGGAKRSLEEATEKRKKMWNAGKILSHLWQASRSHLEAVVVLAAPVVDRSSRNAKTRPHKGGDNSTCLEDLDHRRSMQIRVN